MSLLGGGLGFLSQQQNEAMSAQMRAQQAAQSSYGLANAYATLTNANTTLTITPSMTGGYIVSDSYRDFTYDRPRTAVEWLDNRIAEIRVKL